jgi:hypothetical protein
MAQVSDAAQEMRDKTDDESTEVKRLIRDEFWELMEETLGQMRACIDYVDEDLDEDGGMLEGSSDSDEENEARKIPPPDHWSRGMYEKMRRAVPEVPNRPQEAFTKILDGRGTHFREILEARNISKDREAGGIGKGDQLSRHGHARAFYVKGRDQKRLQNQARRAQYEIREAEIQANREQLGTLYHVYNGSPGLQAKASDFPHKLETKASSGPHDRDSKASGNSPASVRRRTAL